jgi:3-oxoadipate enol-lactonase
LKVNVNGIELAYDDHGIGQPVIFLHAFPLNRGMWEHQVKTLLAEQRFRLITLDWRGFGESQIASDVSSMEMLADDVAGLMDQLGIERAILCGLSMGGYVTFAFLRKYAHRVNGLILADTKPEADSEEVKANRAQLALEQGSDAVANLQLPRLLAPQTLQQAPEVAIRVRQMINAATPLGIAAAARGMALRPDSTAILAHIQCPTLVVAGEHDSVTPPEQARAWAQHIANAQFALIQQAGHLTNLEQPQAFTDTIRYFLHSAFEH